MATTILSFNARGLRDEVKRRAIFNYYRQRAEIICLQEVHSCVEDEKIWSSEYGSRIIFSHGEKNARGVCILLPRNKKYEVILEKRDLEGHLLMVELKCDTITFSLCNVYAPNRDMPKFFTQLCKVIDDMSENRIILGDFNLVIDPILDRNGSMCNNEKSLEVLKQTMLDHLLVEIWRTRNNNVKCYSWMRNRPTYIASRLDFMLVSQGLTDLTENVCYIPGIMSDHLSMFIAVNFMNAERGGGYWKMNAKWLDNETYALEIKEEIEETARTCHKKQPVDKWEILKFQIAHFSKEFAKEKAAESNMIVAQLSEKLDELYDEVASQPDPYKLKLLEHTKADLDQQMEQKAKSAMFRSKATYLGEGERSSKYFFNLEKVRYNGKTCHALINEENGEIVNDPVKVLAMQEQFYRNLYKRDENIFPTFVNDSGIRLTEEEIRMCNQPISEEEVLSAIKQLKSQVTPGIDGIITLFYQKYWESIKEPFMEMTAQVFQQKKLTTTQLLGVINLIPKQNKDSRILGHLRPISLLTTDFKIFEKVMANRIVPTLHRLINMDQKGFLSDRRMSVNIRKIFDLMAYAEENKIEAIILSLDFKKCFDLISFDAVKRALQYFGYPEMMITWCDILYTDFRACVQNNGFFSNEFPIERGVRQGGPCSCYYFLLCAEILAIELRKCPQIKGILVEEILNLLGQYADDADIYMLYDRGSL